MKTTESPSEFAIRDAAWRALHVPTLSDESHNCKHAPALAYVIATNPTGSGKILLRPHEVESFVESAPFFSVHSVFVWEFQWRESFPQSIPDKGKQWLTDRAEMRETNATATLSKWDGKRHHYSIGYNGASGRITWWENLSFATVRNR